jgi:hypothetical protein
MVGMVRKRYGRSGIGTKMIQTFGGLKTMYLFRTFFVPNPTKKHKIFYRSKSYLFRTFFVPNENFPIFLSYPFRTISLTFRTNFVPFSYQVEKKSYLFLPPLSTFTKIHFLVPNSYLKFLPFSYLFRTKSEIVPNSYPIHSIRMWYEFGTLSDLVRIWYEFGTNFA